MYISAYPQIQNIFNHMMLLLLLFFENILVYQYDLLRNVLVYVGINNIYSHIQRYSKLAVMSIAHSTKIGPIPVSKIPVLIWRLMEVIVPNFAADLFFALQTCVEIVS